MHPVVGLRGGVRMMPGYRTLVEFAHRWGWSISSVQKHNRDGFCTWPRMQPKISQHPLYSKYRGIKNRCYTRSASNYANYGGRGVRMCTEWYVDFWAFVRDIDALGPKPEGYSLDRIDNNGDYDPKNVRWASPRTQALNTRDHKSNTSGVRGISYSKRDKSWRVTQYFASLAEATAFLRGREIC